MTKMVITILRQSVSPPAAKIMATPPICPIYIQHRLIRASKEKNHDLLCTTLT